MRIEYGSSFFRALHPLQPFVTFSLRLLRIRLNRLLSLRLWLTATLLLPFLSNGKRSPPGFISRPCPTFTLYIYIYKYIYMGGGDVSF